MADSLGVCFGCEINNRMGLRLAIGSSSKNTPFILRQLGLLKFKAWAEPLPGLCFFRARRAVPENILRIACLARKNLLYFSQYMRRRRIMALHYLETGSTEPEFNLAFEEYVLENKREGDWLILWQNESSVIIGLNQNVSEEVDEAYVSSHGIRVVRRMTGGGAVYHDLGNLN